MFRFTGVKDGTQPFSSLKLAEDWEINRPFATVGHVTDNCG